MENPTTALRSREWAENERLGFAAYVGCFARYGHPHTQYEVEAWRMIGEEQRQMWRDVALSVKKALGG